MEFPQAELHLLELAAAQAAVAVKGLVPQERWDTAGVGLAAAKPSAVAGLRNALDQAEPGRSGNSRFQQEDVQA